jgi:hypothetical protein
VVSAAPTLDHPICYITFISTNLSFRQKQPGVPDASDCSGKTQFRLTENYMLPVTQATGCDTYLLFLLCTWNAVMYTYHQNDTSVTFFTVAAVMLQPFTQQLAMFMPFFG